MKRAESDDRAALTVVEALREGEVFYREVDTDLIAKNLPSVISADSNFVAAVHDGIGGNARKGGA